MATSPLANVPSTSIDVDGLSISTATPSGTDPRPGAIYDPINLAAAVPVHFHPTTSPALGGTNYIMLSSLRWTNATVGANMGVYSAFTPISVPNWVTVNASTGTKRAIGSRLDILITTPGTATLTAAASRGNDMFWALYSIVNGPVTSAVVQHFHYDTVLNTVNPISEEIVPQGSNLSETVNFSAGLQVSSATVPYMYLYGTGSSTNGLYMARKRWARVGNLTVESATQQTQIAALQGLIANTTNVTVLAQLNAQLQQAQQGLATSDETQWEVYTGSGWTTDFTKAGLIQAGLVSHGPLSFAHYSMNRQLRTPVSGQAGYNFMSTVQASGSTRTAQIYSSLSGRPWQPYGSPIALGTAGSTYAGGTLQLQGHVGPNPTLVNAGSATGIPYVISTLSSTAIATVWGLMQVPQLS